MVDLGGPRTRRRRALLAAACALLALAPAPAAAQVLPPQTASQDSLAPEGAPPHWLPARTWVMQHWLPYDEQRLYGLLGADRGDVWRWLRDDTRNLAALAYARGWDPGVLARRLVQPWRAEGVDERRMAVLERRALKTLTQGHLSQHVFFHSLHQNAIPDNAPAIFGVATRDQFQALRRGELSPVQICRLNGLPAGHARARAEATLRAMAERGVRRRSIPRAQAQRLLARQLRQLPRWLDQTRYNGPPPLVNPRPSEATAANFSNNADVAANGRAVAWEGYDAALATVKRKGEINVLARPVRATAAPAVMSPARETGTPAPRSSYNPSISADGRFVAYESAEGNLNFAKRYGRMAIFLRDARRGTTRIVAPPAVPGGARTSYEPSLAADGRTVAFASYVTSPLRDGAVELWVARGRDVRRVRPAGGLRDLGAPVLSGDGRFVVFTATAPGAAGARVYRTAVASGATVAVSPGGADEYEPDVSHDGSRVAYTELAGGRSRVLVADLRGGAPVVTPVPAAGLSAAASLSEPSLSADGATVAFTARGAPERTSVWAADLAAGTTELVSRAAAPADGASSHPSVSGDGRFVAFTSDAWNLSPDKCDAARGVFVRDRARGVTRLLSVGDGANRYTGPTRGSSAAGDMTVELVCAGQSSA